MKEILKNQEFIIDNMVDGLFTVDVNGMITSWNKAAEDMLGYKREEAVGKSCDYLRSDTCMQYKKEHGVGSCRLFAEGSVVKKRCVVTAKDGRKVYLLKNAQVLRDAEGKIVGGVENIVDITDQIEKEQEVSLLRNELKGRATYFKIVGKHHTMQNIYDLLDLAKGSRASVVIYGESGTGKELVAHAIHYSSTRRDGPFVKVNCAALAESVLESELFGHVKGAFTGAERDRKGRLEEAHGGTLFLDEIGDLPLNVQVKLLRFLQEREIERVGDNRPIKVDVRIISGTNTDLDALIRGGKFREDLYYRLNVIPIHIPPLKEKITDIPLLLEHFIEKFSKETGKCIVGCEQEVLDLMMHYEWPGNVRELENVVEYAFVTCRGDKIRAEHLPKQMTDPSSSRAKGRGSDYGAVERNRIVEALKVSGGNRTEAARSLGVSRVTLWKKMKRYGIGQGRL
jgi:PAS domain S-box-containing protein